MQISANIKKFLNCMVIVRSMKILIENPFTRWKNLTASPCVVIKRDIVRLGELLHKLHSSVISLKSGGARLNNILSQAAKLDFEIKRKLEELKKTKDMKKQEKMLAALRYLKKRRESVLKSDRGIEDDFVSKASDSYVDFIETINIFYRLNIQCLTLIHRARKNIDELITRVKSVKHANVKALEPLKAQSITKFIWLKASLKALCDELYRSSEYQSRNVFNPEEAMKEFSLQSTYVKIKRVKRLAIEIDTLEEYIHVVSKNLLLVNVSHLADSQLSRQIYDIADISHHIKILTQRFNTLLQSYPHSKKLKKPFRKVLRRIVRQTRLLLNSIKVEHYAPKIEKKQQNILKSRKKPEPESRLEEIAKAA